MKCQNVISGKKKYIYLKKKKYHQLGVCLLCLESDKGNIVRLIQIIFKRGWWMMVIATEIRGGIHIIFFLFLHENICCGYSLEAPYRGASNEYPQHMFLWRNKKDISIFRMKKTPYLLLCSKYERKS